MVRPSAAPIINMIMNIVFIHLGKLLERTVSDAAVLEPVCW
jgi:hypothetical protein